MGRTCGEPDDIELTAMGVGLNGSQVRNSLALINGGDRRLRDDNAKKSWIRSRLTRAQNKSNPPPIDLTYIVPYSKQNGLKISVDRAQNLPKTKLHFPMMRLITPDKALDDMMGVDLFGNTRMDWECVAPRTTAPYRACCVAPRTSAPPHLCTSLVPRCAGPCGTWRIPSLFCVA